MDNLPYEVRRLIIERIPEYRWGPLRAVSRGFLAQIRGITLESVQCSPASFAPDRVYSMYTWLTVSRVPPDQKYRIVLKHMPRCGLVKWMLRRSAPKPEIVTKFADTIVSMPNHPYTRIERARVLALFGQNTNRNAAIAAMTGVIDLIVCGTTVTSILDTAIKAGHDEVAYLLADKSTMATWTRKYVDVVIKRRDVLS